ncbi:MAG: amidohydrolase family protein [Luteitalea sp.]|nr:amidohydrolase family protein [Luteitalea sp.]
MAPAAGAQVVDGRGKFLMPGMWDMHSHAATAESWLKLYVANGVTAIRDMGSDLDPVLAMRDRTASGRVLGPRIFTAGPILDDPPGDWPLRLRVKTAEDGRAAVQMLKRRGGDEGHGQRRRRHPGRLRHDDRRLLRAGRARRHGPRRNDSAGRLQTATLNPARYFDLEQTLGSVAPGRTANLVLLDANPLIDIAHVRRVRAVVLAGRFLDRKELDNVLAQVKIAAAQP